MKRKLFVTTAEHRQIIIWMDEIRTVMTHERDDAVADAFAWRKMENIADLCGISVADLRGAPIGQPPVETYLSVIPGATEITPEDRIREEG